MLFCSFWSRDVEMGGSFCLPRLDPPTLLSELGSADCLMRCRSIVPLIEELKPGLFDFFVSFDLTVAVSFFFSSSCTFSFISSR